MDPKLYKCDKPLTRQKLYILNSTEVLNPIKNTNDNGSPNDKYIS